MTNRRVRALLFIGISMLTMGIIGMARGSTAACACFGAAASTISAANSIRRKDGC